ncbi:hypothetical protein G4Y79_15330 [Phototrophicus methaneseepsis]|uniref:Uncharacterized protein n=1 Tax=Phototrophicus methaneseepsis TaxID=2710758 RepID=A0A7S8IC22_9CHLR|nr:hypothetical protein [Phototrophicus methaneseepsis]QPC81075.1 hypothetical protein G4Y79_15330 [Phototrophicus methaneseepsis]
MVKNEFGDFIPTANSEPQVRAAGGYRPWLMSLMKSRPPYIAPDLDDCKGVVYAEVISGTWAVKCPFTGCHGALVAEPGEPYFCPDCLNQENNFKPCNVVFPEKKEVIETLLLIRPKPNRNWVVGETMESLRFENAAYLAKVGKSK